MLKVLVKNYDAYSDHKKAVWKQIHTSTFDLMWFCPYDLSRHPN